MSASPPRAQYTPLQVLALDESMAVGRGEEVLVWDGAATSTPVPRRQYFYAQRMGDDPAAADLELGSRGPMTGGSPPTISRRRRALYADVNSFASKLKLLLEIEETGIPTPAKNIPVFTGGELAAACAGKSLCQVEEIAQTWLREQVQTLSIGALRQRALELGVQKEKLDRKNKDAVIRLIEESEPVQNRALALLDRYRNVVLSLAVSPPCDLRWHVA
jgi:hypothetical protein